ncbi:MAG: hypothetical protein JSW48_04860 [Betaproteobacteria bacterium]|jgi:predicted small secreted protein|nr:MAG: hypothetical protein JSW48_04860 [Betaproteobacteria bacterium]
MKRLRFLFLTLVVSAMCVDAGASDNVFRQIGKDASKAAKQAGKAAKQVANGVGSEAKKVGKAISGETRKLFRD